ncbi:hypothetical protein [Nocardia anaemiae]|uniref:hypothetical protein n=1 Tax=Nocardia anaemiae TaxID=263910 RepID=UPI0012F4A9AB|nr:hypothetical protein [Nocardia anaemiae]
MPDAATIKDLSAPPLRPQQYPGDDKNDHRSGKSCRTALPIRKNLCTEADRRGGDMPRYRFAAGPGKPTPSSDYRGTDND